MSQIIEHTKNLLNFVFFLFILVKAVESMAQVPGYFSTLLSGTGCNADGSTSNNPIASIVDGLLSSHVPDSIQQSIFSQGNDLFEPQQQMLELEHVLDEQVTPTGSSLDSVWNSQIAQASMTGNHGALHEPYMMQAIQQQQYLMQMQLQQQQLYLQQQHQINGGVTSSSSSSSSLRNSTVRLSSAEAIDLSGESFAEADLELEAEAELDIAREVIIEVEEEYDQGCLYAISDTSSYDFVTTLNDNRFRDQTQGADVNAFEMGVTLFDGGDIAGAIEAFEMELLRDSTHDECWKYLGLCHAENDDDLRAIQCFNHSIEHDPFNLDALLLLGTAYTNEQQNARALHCIRQWVTHNPEFHGITINDQTEHGSSTALEENSEQQQDPYGDGSVLDRTIQLMQAVSDQAENSSGTSIDTVVQVNSLLGVLYNVSQDHDAAIQSLRRAVAAAPREYSLHNKVGRRIQYVTNFIICYV